MRLTLAHLSSQWRSMITVVVGILLVTVIGASAPLYTLAISQVGMMQRLEQQFPADVHLVTRTNLSAAQTDDIGAAWSAYSAEINMLSQQIFDVDFPNWKTQVCIFAETLPIPVIRDGEMLESRLQIAYYDNWMEMTRLVEGTWPQTLPNPTIAVEAALGVNVASMLGLNVGDEITLDQGTENRSNPIPVRITALVAEDETGSFTDVLTPLRMGHSRNGEIEANFLTTRESFLHVTTEYVPQMRSTFGWWVLFNHFGLPFSRVSQAVSRLDEYESAVLELPDTPDLPELNLRYRSQLSRILSDYTSEITTMNAPIGLLLLQIAALSAFFLLVMAILVRRSERHEIALFQSRGAINRQIIILRGFEAFIICLGAAVAAPFIARLILTWIVPQITHIDQLPLLLDREVFIYSGAAGAVSFVVWVSTLRPILRLPLVMAGGGASRSEKQMWWQRYYVDILLLVVGMLAFWRLLSNESLLTTTQVGDIKTDPLLLLTPILLFIAAGSVFLRLFPKLCELLAQFFARRRELEGVLATWQVSREPTHYGRITFLLTLAVGIGWMVSSFQATLERSQHDRSAYSVGADIRLEERNTYIDADRVHSADIYLEMPGVEAASAAWRYFIGNASRDRDVSMNGEILAIDAATFADVSYWRDDLGELALPPALERVASPPGRALPFIPERIGFWVQVEQRTYREDFGVNFRMLLSRMQFGMRFRDAEGTFIHIPFTPAISTEENPDPAEWIYFEGDLGTLAHEPHESLRLETLYWNSPGWVSSFCTTGFTVTDDEDASTVLDWLTEDERWETIFVAENPITENMVIPAEQGGPGESCRLAQWAGFDTGNQLGLVLNYPDSGPIPALVSHKLATLNTLLPGTLFQIGRIEGSDIRFEMVDTVAYYPTLYPDKRLFVVVDLNSLLYALNRRPGASIYPSEMWLTLADDVSTEAVMDTLYTQREGWVVKNAQTQDEVLNELQMDMLLVGLIGLLYLAFGVALTLSVISLFSYTTLMVQQRRSEFGVLQALGLPSSRLIMTIAFEQIIVMVVAVLLGAVLGSAVSSQVLPVLANGGAGETLAPPLIVRIELVALLQYAGIILAVLMMTLGLNLVLVKRLSPAQTLRFDEE